MPFGGVVFLAGFALFWITTTPFVDLRDPSVLLATDAGGLIEPLVVVPLSAVSAAVLWWRWDAARLAFSPALAAVLAWQAVTVAASTHPDLSLRRYALSLFVTTIALAQPLTVRDKDQYLRLLAIGCGVVLFVAYAGIVALPERSIHNLAEVLELSNAGSWRGHFSHKNVAGAAMVVVMAYGLAIARLKSLPAGWTIAALSALFLLNTNNKTSIAIVAGTFILSELASRSRSLALKACATLVPIIALLTFTVGSVLFAPVGSLVAAVSSDPTFTNRTMIWRFSLDNLAQRWLTGFGYEAFWATSSLLNGGSIMESQAATAGHAHDGYLNIALTTGVPGLLLCAWWLLWQPLRDYHASQTSGNDPTIGLMYLRVWLFTMLYACLESPFFLARGPIWFAMLGAVFGLRLHARSRERRVSLSATRAWTAPVPAGSLR